MVTLTTHRQYAEDVLLNLFPYINMLKLTHTKEVAKYSRVSDARLMVKLVNSILDEIETVIRKKIVLTTGRKIHIKFSDAAAITLYKTLLNLPLDKDKVHLHMIRQEWIEILDKQIFAVDDLAKVKN